METVHQRFEQQADCTPDQVAVHFADTTLTYRELNQQANQLAHYLRKQGIGPETLVGLALERSPQMVIGLLAILKAGGAFLPLDPTYPPQRLAFMLVDSRARFVLTQSDASALFNRIRLPGVQTIVLDRDWPQIALESTANPPNLTHPDHLLYALYTSGSTGRPKGVAGAHHATLNRLQWMADAYPFQTGEACCQKTPLSFVDAVAEIFGPLLAGIPLVIVPDEQVKDPFRLVQTLADQHISRIVVVPSLLHAALEAYDMAESRLVAPRLWVCSGETLPPDLALRFREVLPESTLLNLYGSSEVAADVTYYDSTAAPVESPTLIGTPIDGVQVYVLDEQLHPVADGTTGELYVGGEALARGYLNCPALTAERFLPNPFGEPGTRLYRTGDLVRRLPDGNLVFVGRVDQQVKLRGIRIELGEIEARLRQHEWIKDSAVMLHEDSARGGHLVAYVVLAKPVVERDLLHQMLVEWLQHDLPTYMIPAEFVALESFPHTPNGKLDRVVLRAARRFVAPSPAGIVSNTPTEMVVARLWTEVFAEPQVGPHSDFFELGGHSLLAARIVVRLRELLNVPLDVRDVFEYPTVSLLSQRIQALESAESHAVAALPIQPIPRLAR